MRLTSACADVQMPTSLLIDMLAPFYDTLRGSDCDVALAERVLRDIFRPLVAMVRDGDCLYELYACLCIRTTQVLAGNREATEAASARAAEAGESFVAGESSEEGAVHATEAAAAGLTSPCGR